MTAHIGNKTSVPVDGGGQTTESELNIQGSVGRGGRNHGEDVKSIQNALNRVPKTQGGPLPPLVVDGLNGPKTERAIYVFQMQHFGAMRADARVDPGGRTLAKLREFQTQNQFAAAGLPSGTAALGFTSISSVKHSDASTVMKQVKDNTIVFGSVLAAKRRLAEAIAFVQGTRKSEWGEAEALVHRCFKIRDAGSTNAQVLAIQKIDRLYTHMPKVHAQRNSLYHPMSGANCFDGKIKKNAFAFVGGFHRPDTEIDGKTKLRVRGIYFCTDNISSMVPQRVADLIVHEMAHFVGPSPGQPGAIRHSAGGGSAALKARHDQMIVTAANYAWLAWLARLPRARWLTDPG